MALSCLQGVRLPFALLSALVYAGVSVQFKHSQSDTQSRDEPGEGEDGTQVFDVQAFDGTNVEEEKYMWSDNSEMIGLDNKIEDLELDMKCGFMPGDQHRCESSQGSVWLSAKSLCSDAENLEWSSKKGNWTDRPGIGKWGPFQNLSDSAIAVWRKMRPIGAIAIEHGPDTCLVEPRPNDTAIRRKTVKTEQITYVQKSAEPFCNESMHQPIIENITSKFFNVEGPLKNVAEKRSYAIVWPSTPCNETHPCPVVMILYGVDEHGPRLNDTKMQDAFGKMKAWGWLHFLERDSKCRAELRSILVFPQIVYGESWVNNAPELHKYYTLPLLRTISPDRPEIIDKERVALIGYSEGSVGALQAAALYPHVFSVVAAVAASLTEDWWRSLRMANFNNLDWFHSRPENAFQLQNAGPGTEAALTEEGYQEVAKMKDNEEMKAFIRRLLATHHRSPPENDVFNAMVPYFSGKIAVQGIERLEVEALRLTKKQKVKGLGSKVLLSEAGYRQVAQLKDDEEMKDFTVRILDKFGRKPPDDESGLTGFVRYFSGTQGTQDFERLKWGALDLTRGQWVPGPGTKAGLDEAGYQWVAKFQDDLQMMDFVKRVLGLVGRKPPSDTAGLAGFVRFFSGTASVQDFDRLKWGCLELTKDQHKPGPGSTASLDDAGYQQVSELKNDLEMLDFARRLLESKGRKAPSFAELGGFVKFYSGSTAVQDYSRLVAGLLDLTRSQKEPGPGSKVQLNQEGYEEIAKLKDNAEMSDFTIRLLAMHNRQAPPVGSLGGFVRYFSGTESTQDFERLKWGALELTQDQQVAGAGSQASLDEEGYKEIAVMKDDLLMIEFATRVLADHNRQPPPMATFGCFIKWFSGTAKVQDFSKLESELIDLTKDQDGSSLMLLRSHAVFGAGDEKPLTEWGYQETAKLKDNDAMTEFVRRLLQKYGRELPPVGSVAGAVPFFSGVQSTQDFARLEADFLKLTEDQKVPGPGSKVALNQAGYDRIVALKNNEEMKDFAKRVMWDRKRTPPEDAKLYSFVKYYSGTVETQDFGALVAGCLELTIDQKLPGIGSKAPLSEEGYQQVINMDDVYLLNEEMKDYVKRVLDKHGRTANDAAISGFVPYFSGQVSIQTFESLEAGVMEMTKEQKVDGPGMKMPLTEWGYQEVAKHKDNEEMMDFMRRALKKIGRTAEDGQLRWCASRFSGTKKTQDYAHLETELYDLTRDQRKFRHENWRLKMLLVNLGEWDFINNQTSNLEHLLTLIDATRLVDRTSLQVRYYGGLLHTDTRDRVFNRWRGFTEIFWRGNYDTLGSIHNELPEALESITGDWNTLSESNGDLLKQADAA